MPATFRFIPTKPEKIINAYPSFASAKLKKIALTTEWEAVWIDKTIASNSQRSQRSQISKMHLSDFLTCKISFWIYFTWSYAEYTSFQKQRKRERMISFTIFFNAHSGFLWMQMYSCILPSHPCSRVHYLVWCVIYFPSDLTPLDK